MTRPTSKQIEALEDPEVKTLAVAQRTDDSRRMLDTQRLGGQRTLSIDSLKGHDADYDSWLADDSLEPFNVMTGNPDDDQPYALAWVANVVAGLSYAQRQAYHMVMVERMSEEDAGRELGITQQAIHHRLERVKEAVRAAAIERGAFTE